MQHFSELIYDENKKIKSLPQKFRKCRIFSEDNFITNAMLAIPSTLLTDLRYLSELQISEWKIALTLSLCGSNLVMIDSIQ